MIRVERKTVASKTPEQHREISRVFQKDAQTMEERGPREIEKDYE